VRLSLLTFARLRSSLYINASRARDASTVRSSTDEAGHLAHLRACGQLLPPAVPHLSCHLFFCVASGCQHLYSQRARHLYAYWQTRLLTTARACALPPLRFVCLVGSFPIRLVRLVLRFCITSGICCLPFYRLHMLRACSRFCSQAALVVLRPHKTVCTVLTAFRSGSYVSRSGCGWFSYESALPIRSPNTTGLDTNNTPPAPATCRY